MNCSSPSSGGGKILCYKILKGIEENSQHSKFFPSRFSLKSCFWYTYNSVIFFHGRE